MEQKKDKWEAITNYLQAVCSNHEYLEVKLTTSSNDGFDINYQCKHCGHTISVSEKAILDKAKEMVEKFYKLSFDVLHTDCEGDRAIASGTPTINNAKECAKMAIDEIIDACEYNSVESWNTDWWNKVKAKIDGVVV